MLSLAFGPISLKRRPIDPNHINLIRNRPSFWLLLTLSASDGENLYRTKILREE